MIKSLFILGAGASADAGLPTANQLMDYIIEDFRSVNSYYGGRFFRVLEYINSSIKKYRSSQEGFYQPIFDIEEVVTILTFLRDREILEVAPFVTQWDKGVLVLDDPDFNSNSNSWVDKLLAENGKSFPNRNAFIKAFAEGVRSTSGQASNSGVFQHLLIELYRQMRLRLNLSSNIDLLYLSKLAKFAQKSSSSICTLNYDKSFETASSAVNISCDTGISNWEKSGLLEFDLNKIKYLKIHGSIDWIRKNYKPGNSGQLSNYPLIEVNENPSPSDIPFILFGKREKLQADGPFLNLLSEFHREVVGATNILIAGYSFRDHHVNTEIYRWMEINPHGQLTIVDPTFPANGSFYNSNDDRYEFIKHIQVAKGHNFAQIESSFLDIRRETFKEYCLKTYY